MDADGAGVGIATVDTTAATVVGCDSAVDVVTGDTVGLGVAGEAPAVDSTGVGKTREATGTDVAVGATVGNATVAAATLPVSGPITPISAAMPIMSASRLIS